MAEGLDVGTLTGRIELEDRFTKVLEQIGGSIGRFEEGFKSAGSTVLEQAASFFTAEAALHAVEEAFHLGIETLKELTLEGSHVADVEKNFDHLTETAGRLGSTLLNTVKEGTHNTISDFELMKTLNRDLAAGLALTDQQFSVVSKGAYALATATGTDVKDALDKVNMALLTGRTRQIAMLTGQIDLVKAEEDYAARLNVRVDTLTAEEKIQAKREAILTKLADATGRLGEQTEGLDKKVAQVATVWANFEEELGKTVATSPVILTAFDDIRAAISEAFGGSTQTAVRTIADLIDDAAISTLKFAETGADVVGVVGREWEAVKVVFKDLEQIVGGDVLVFKYLAEGVAEVGKLLHLPGAADDLERIDNEIGKLMQSMVERGKSLQDDKKAEEEWGVVSGQLGEKIAEIRRHMEEVKAAQVAATQATNEGTESTNKASLATGSFSNSMTSLGSATRLTKEEQKALDEALKEMASTGKTWQDTLLTINGNTVEGIKYYLEAGVALDKLAVAYGLTKTQADAIGKSWKQDTETLKEQIKAAEMLGDAWTKYYEELADLTATDLEKANAASLKKYDDTVKKLQDMGVSDEKYYNAAWDLYELDVQKNSAALISKDQHTRAYLDQQIRQEEEKYRTMQQFSDQYTEKDLANQAKIVQSLKDQKSHWGEINAVIDKQTEMVETLAGEVITLKEAEARKLAGGSADVNVGNFSQNALSSGLNAAQAEAMARKGYSFQQIVEILRANPSINVNTLPPGQGPRIPGFREGGIGDFGDGTLAMLHGKEAIVPLDKATSTIGSTNLIFNVNGTATQVAQQIKDIIIRELQTRRQFS